MQIQPNKLYTVDELKQLIGTVSHSEQPKEINEVVPGIFNHLAKGSSSSFFIITDYSEMKILYTCDNAEHITGYPVNMLMKGGPEFMLSLFHPDEMEPLRQIHKQIFSFFGALPANDRLNYSYSYDIRLRRADGEYVRLKSHLDCMELDCDGHLWLGRETFTDITSFDNGTSMTLVISHLAKENGIRDVVYHFDTGADDHHLSKRQRQINELVSEGRSSKEIAQMLHLSRHTVDTHRRRIKKK